MADRAWEYRPRLTRWPLAVLLAPLILLASGHKFGRVRGGEVACTCGAVAGRLVTTAPHGLYFMGDDYTALAPSEMRQCLLTWAWRLHWFRRGARRKEIGRG